MEHLQSRNRYACFLVLSYNMGFNITATKQIARSKGDRKLTQQIASTTFTASVLISILSFVILLVTLLSLNIQYQFIKIALFSLITVSSQSLLPVWLFNGLNHVKLIAVASAVSNVFFIVAIFLFVKAEQHAIRVPQIQSLMASLTLIYAILASWKIFQIKLIHMSLSIKDIFQVLIVNKNSFIVQFAPNIYNNACTVILGALGTSFDAGLFSAVKRITDAISSPALILTNTFISKISTDLDIFKLYKNIMLSSGAIMSSLIWLFADELELIFFNNVSGDTAFLIRAFSPGLFFHFTMMCYGQTYLMLTEKERRYRNSVLIASLCSLPVSLITISTLGPLGAIYNHYHSTASDKPRIL